MKKIIPIGISLFLLLPSLVYGLIVVGGNTNTSVPFSIVTTNAATSITGTSATLNGTAYNYNSVGNSFFNYGLTSAYGSQTSQSAFAGNTVTTSFSANVTGLSVSTTYHFQACVSNSAGVSCGGDLTFVPVGIARLAAYPTGITNPTAIVLNSTLDYLYVAGGGGTYGMSLDGLGGLYVTSVGSGNLIVSKIRTSDFVVTNTRTIASVNGLYKLSTVDLSTQATSFSSGFGLNANSLWVISTYIGSATEVINTPMAYIQLPINTNSTLYGSNLGANSQLRAGTTQLPGVSVCYFVEYLKGVLMKATNCVTYLSEINLSDLQSDYNSSTIDVSNIYVGGQYKLSKVSISSFTLTTQTAFAEISPSTINPPTRVCLSSTNYVYCARESFTSPSTYNPSWVTTFTKSDMSEQPALVLQSGEDRLIAGAIDNTNNLMYLLSYDNGSIIKFSITP